MYSKANQKNTVGFVLHAVPYQENSLLVDAITADFGRISFVARGAKSKRSSLKAALQVFVPLKLTLSGTDKSLKTLVRCEVSGRQFQYLPPVLFSALYVNELLAALYKIEDNYKRTITLGENGIIYNDGSIQKIALFDKDTEGRITSISYDSMKVEYSYDDKGDLVKVTDIGGYKTTFEYDDHYVVKVRDNDNKEIAINEYEDGRLKTTTD